MGVIEKAVNDLIVERTKLIKENKELPNAWSCDVVITSEFGYVIEIDESVFEAAEINSYNDNEIICMIMNHIFELIKFDLCCTVETSYAN